MVMLKLKPAEDKLKSLNLSEALIHFIHLFLQHKNLLYFSPSNGRIREEGGDHNQLIPLV